MSGHFRGHLSTELEPIVKSITTTVSESWKRTRDLIASPVAATSVSWGIRVDNADSSEATAPLSVAEQLNGEKGRGRHTTQPRRGSSNARFSFDGKPAEWLRRSGDSSSSKSVKFGAARSNVASPPTPVASSIVNSDPPTQKITFV